MKGFIEVTQPGLGHGKKLINISCICEIQGDIILTNDGNAFKVKESYEEIKELIKQAT